MTVEQFLQDYTPGADNSDETLAELSAISNTDAATLARRWLSWTDEEVLELQTKLAELALLDTTMEFECIFKAGLGHQNSAVRSSAVHGLSETGDTTAISRVLELMTNDDDEEVQTAAASAMSAVAELAA
jgi:HEAT repeat protein